LRQRVVRFPEWHSLRRPSAASADTKASFTVELVASTTTTDYALISEPAAVVHCFGDDTADWKTEDAGVNLVGLCSSSPRQGQVISDHNVACASPIADTQRRNACSADYTIENCTQQLSIMPFCADNSVLEAGLHLKLLLKDWRDERVFLRATT